MILDVLLPDVNGLAVCQALRAKSRVAILLLSARGDEASKIRGFRLGADDYVVKPFSPREVLARVQALIRRANIVAGATMAELCFPDLGIDVARRRVERDGQVIQVTAREFDLLLHLARRPRRIFTNNELLDDVWGCDCAIEPGTVTVHMHRLRNKLERNPAHPRYLKTVLGVGYKFDPAGACGCAAPSPLPMHHAEAARQSRVTSPGNTTAIEGSRRLNQYGPSAKRTLGRPRERRSARKQGYWFSDVVVPFDHCSS
ncbi:MAG: winged helix-turn-helix domain-containing protein [Chloroflexota bacterium]